MSIATDTTVAESCVRITQLEEAVTRLADAVAALTSRIADIDQREAARGKPR